METVYTNLTRYGIRRMHEQAERSLVLQILEIIKLPKTQQNSSERFRVLVSDGFYKTRVVFGNEAGVKILQEILLPKSIIITEEIMQTEYNNKIVMVVLKFRTVFSKVNEVIGNPINIPESRLLDYSNNGSNAIPPKFLHDQKIIKTPIPSKKGDPQFSLICRSGGKDLSPSNNKYKKSGSGQNEYPNTNQSLVYNLNDKGQNGVPKRISSPGMPNKDKDPICDVSQLAAYQENVTIKARVLKKYGLKRFRSPQGEGQVFSIDVIDSSGNEIQCCFFNSAAILHNEKVEVGKVYIFTNGAVRPANGAPFSSKNDLKIVMDATTEIIDVPDDETISREKFKLTRLDKIKTLPGGFPLDVLALVVDVSPMQTVSTKIGDFRGKRNLSISDETGTVMEIVFWSAHAEREYHKNEILLFKDMKINDYAGVRNLTNTFQTRVVEVSENLPEPEEIAPLYDIPTSYSFKTIEQIEEECSQTIKSPTEKVYNDIVAFVFYIKNDMMYYVSCPNDKCTKKVIEEGGLFRCESCRNVYEKPRARFIINARISDYTQTSWTVFNDVTGGQMLGHSADEIRQLRLANKEEEISEILRKATFREFRMRVLTRLDNFGSGEFKMKHFVVKVYNNELAKENRDMYEEILNYLEMERK